MFLSFCLLFNANLLQNIQRLFHVKQRFFPRRRPPFSIKHEGGARGRGPCSGTCTPGGRDMRSSCWVKSFRFLVRRRLSLPAASSAACLSPGQVRVRPSSCGLCVCVWGGSPPWQRPDGGCSCCSCCPGRRVCPTALAPLVFLALLLDLTRFTLQLVNIIV